MRTLPICLLFLCLSTVYAGQLPPYSSQLDEISPDCDSNNIECVKAGWHLEYIGMPDVWRRYNLFGDWINKGPGVTSFKIGVVDSGVSQAGVHQHDSIDFNLLEIKNSIEIPKRGQATHHGNMVVGALSASTLGLELKSRPMLRANIVFWGKIRRGTTDNYSTFHALRELLNSDSNISIVNISQVTEFSKWWSVKAKSYGHSGDYYNYYPMRHWEYTRTLRKLIDENPDILFVFASGNSKGSSMHSNGMLHRSTIRTNGSYRQDKLDNLIIVASNTNEGIINLTSESGKDIDISAPSNYLGLSCSNKIRDGYKEAKGTQHSMYGKDYKKPRSWIYTIKANSANSIGSLVDEYYYKDLKCNGRYPAGGTSAAAPLVSGAAAILKHIANLNKYQISPAKIKEYLLDNKRPRATLKYKNKAGDFKILKHPIPLLHVTTSVNNLLADIEDEKVKVTDVAPKTAIAGQEQVFTIEGQNLPLTTNVSLEGAINNCTVEGGKSETEQIFRCLPSDQTGSYKMYIKESLGGDDIEGTPVAIDVTASNNYITTYTESGVSLTSIASEEFPAQAFKHQSDRSILTVDGSICLEAEITNNRGYEDIYTEAVILNIYPNTNSTISFKRGCNEFEDEHIIDTDQIQPQITLLGRTQINSTNGFSISESKHILMRGRGTHVEDAYMYFD